MKIDLEREVLRALDENTYLTPEETLLNQLNLALPDAVTSPELTAVLFELAAKRQVVRFKEGKITKWKITPEGQTRLLIR
jgi:hypothetical protein